MSRKNPSEIDGTIIRLLSLKYDEFDSYMSTEEHEEVLASDAVQFVARLHLLAIGDDRQSKLMEEPKRTMTHQTIAANVDLPISIYQEVMRRHEAEMAASVDCLTDDSETDMDDSYTIRFVRSTVYVDCCKVLKTANISAVGNSVDRRRVIAAGLLETIAASFFQPGYAINPKTLSLQWSVKANVVSCLLEYIVDKKLSTCPVCGAPVLMPRKSSSPFCKKSHQVKYHKQARNRLKRGSSVDEVASGFPHIKRETIEAWHQEVS